MYTLKVSYGYGDVDEPETETVDIIGVYEDEEEAAKAAETKFAEIGERIGDDDDVRFWDVEHSRYRYYVMYGYCDYELGIVHPDHYYEVSVIER